MNTMTGKQRKKTGQSHGAERLHTVHLPGAPVPAQNVWAPVTANRCGQGVPMANLQNGIGNPWKLCTGMIHPFLEIQAVRRAVRAHRSLFPTWLQKLFSPRETATWWGLGTALVPAHSPTQPKLQLLPLLMSQLSTITTDATLQMEWWNILTNNYESGLAVTIMVRDYHFQSLT